MNHLLAYSVIGIYLVLLMVVGVVMQRFNRDSSDYFRSGCKGTWWLVGSSAFMGAFSAWTFSGASGAAYESGWSVAVVYLANAAGFAVNAIWLAPWFRQMRAITVPQVIEQRFGRVTQQFYAWINVVLGLLYAALWLYGLAIFVSAVFGLPIRGVVIAVGLAVLTYAVLGGSWAVMSNDFLQTLILVPITLLVAYLSLEAVGGVDVFWQRCTTGEYAGDFALFNDPQQ
ncbi:MAG: sodium:solute symporter, partial [Phycisphaeraceae bacterium JB051]